MFPWESIWTLTCSIKTSPTSWKYYWYKDDKSSEFLPTQDAVEHRNGRISVSQKGRYWCRGGRGDPVYYSYFSQPVNINNSGEFGFVIQRMFYNYIVIWCRFKHLSYYWSFFLIYRNSPKNCDCDPEIWLVHGVPGREIYSHVWDSRWRHRMGVWMENKQLIQAFKPAETQSWLCFSFSYWKLCM